ncbi:sugar transferase [Listeria grandensis]|uniref:Sugar transferase n=1 Tax=Listeria grandensis TaxID=1494963 RepID=A0A7X0Y420_9LIST|nr:sugar transferase [Listeria grandensis]MBC1474005.1 sugar transferase [Listeria grandensis]MBC1936393.1 sugar transferase [Listeria grandensis]
MGKITNDKDYHILIEKRARAVSKRIVDVLVAVIGIIVTAPIMVLIAICIKLEDKGPVLFVQTRTGQNGELFSIYKFRSMRFCPRNKNQKKYGQGWDKGVPDSFIFKDGSVANPNVTKVGVIIRRTSLDELPQFFNVLLGDMSIVGPRPEIPEITAYYSKEQRTRLLVKPGITGWAQVNGRSLITNGEKMRMDHHYVLHQSLYLDICILMLTIKVVLTSKGAV